MIIPVSALWINNNNSLAYAQNTNSTNIQQQPPQPPKLHAVKITSPTKGQQVFIGENNNNLKISGISIANATSHCQVSVIVNDVKPYQNASATGPGGAADYSKWNFVLSSKYTTIKQGPDNKITAKFTCSDNPAAVSFYSVNATGVVAGAAGRQQPSAITGNSTAAAG